MKINCNRKDLLDALSLASQIVPTRTPKEVLRYVRLHVEADGTLHLTATNLEAGVRCAVDGEVYRSGEVLLPHQQAMSLMRTLPDDFVEIDVDDQGAKIRAARGKFSLPIMPAKDFPALPLESKSEDPITITVDALRLKQMLRQVMWSCEEADSRYALGGVRLEYDGLLTAVATNGRTLAVARTGIESTGPIDTLDSCAIIIPQRLVATIISTLPDKGEATIVTSMNEVIVLVEQTAVVARLLEGRFPPWRKILGADTSSDAHVEVSELSLAVKQAGIFTTEESRGVNFDFREGELQIQNRSAVMGASDITVPISLEGDPLKVTLDPRFVQKALGQTESDSVTIGMRGAEDVVRFSDGEGTGFQAVIMPFAQEREPVENQEEAEPAAV